MTTGEVLQLYPASCLTFRTCAPHQHNSHPSGCMLSFYSVCVCVCARAHARARACVCMHACVYACMCVCVCAGGGGGGGGVCFNKQPGSLLSVLVRTLTSGCMDLKTGRSINVIWLCTQQNSECQIPITSTNSQNTPSEKSAPSSEVYSPHR